MAPRYDALLAGHGIGWQRDRVAAVEPDSCHVVLESGQRLHYSQLVIATGAKPDSFGIPGVEDHALRFHSLEMWKPCDPTPHHPQSGGHRWRWSQRG